MGYDKEVHNRLQWNSNRVQKKEKDAMGIRQNYEEDRRKETVDEEEKSLEKNLYLYSEA